MTSLSDSQGCFFPQTWVVELGLEKNILPGGGLMVIYHSTTLRIQINVLRKGNFPYNPILGMGLRPSILL